ncbi:MAG: class I SAM-dependent methyltransferase, partial [Actinomycetota bacterium]|nr:class I SAM-dependent methyltransferase [Actinomycetota bacterium]
MGTGTGIQAILAARHADHVVATDVSERALAFVSLNAALNGVDNIELRQGSFFEPVAGEQFDLVICNPPYAITPDTSYLYRDGGLGGDSVAEHVVRELPKFLAEGSFGSTMLSWIREGD